MFFVDQTAEAIRRDAATCGIHEVKPSEKNEIHRNRSRMWRYRTFGNLQLIQKGEEMVSI